ncbi:NTP transferase domain-containing protein [Microbispora sp. ZYX-F-249]|uniref:NTP transferase domain-containing protein n=1 Tax=Microbispora maris TaxID=3144104 RepID=A0ABV0B0J1_9ACTN
MSDLRTCAVIPAAGQGSRLGMETPKIMLEIADGVTVWSLLLRRLRPWVEHVHVVLSPSGEAPFRRLAAEEIARGEVSVSVQAEPTGMGDAVFGAAPYWRDHDAILVVWGDQANVSAATLRRVVHVHGETASPDRPGLTIPLVPLPDPYVEYEYDAATSGLLGVRMSREGDLCRPGGLGDVGVFCLSTRGLTEAWDRYLAEVLPGTVTGEVNFLPFLPYLSGEGRPVTVVPAGDPDEARGINTAADLEFARTIYLRRAD